MTTLIGPTISVRFVLSLLAIVALADASAGEPERAKGLSVHMLPDRVAQIDGRSGGFIVRDSGGESIYPDARALIVFFQTLSGSTRENGIWVVTSNPTAYSEMERAKLKMLVAVCDEKRIPVFTCRGSELPQGWKRSDVPTGWNNLASEH